MCLITPLKEKKIAEEDITVYKVLIYGSSLLQGFTYEKDILYETKIEDSYDWCAADSFSLEILNKEYPDFRKGFNRDKLICIGQGFHSCNSVKRAQEMKDCKSEKIHEFLIPKGSEYYEDLSGLLVSNKIKRIT
jgi:hypothetical protein